MAIESQKMLLKYVLPPNFFVGPDVPPPFCMLETPLSVSLLVCLLRLVTVISGVGNLVINVWNDDDDDGVSVETTYDLQSPSTSFVSSCDRRGQFLQ